MSNPNSAHPATAVEQPSAGGPSRVTLRSTGWSFVLLLLLSAGMADVPDRTLPTAVVRHFYQHTTVILLAQALSVAAAVCFTVFATTLARDLHGSRAVARTGRFVAGAAVLTSLPVAVLAVAHDVPDKTLRLLAAACDATDVLLFLAISAFSAAFARGTSSPAWRVLGAACAVIGIARALLLALSAAALGVVAPVSFVLLVAGLATLPATGISAKLPRGSHPAERSSALTATASDAFRTTRSAGRRSCDIPG